MKKGVKKRILPEPNPTKIEFSKTSTLQAIFKKATELYFSDIDDIEENGYKLNLADSNGIPLHIEKMDSWVLSEFYQHNGLQPSRYKLYVMLDFGSISVS